MQELCKCYSNKTQQIQQERQKICGNLHVANAFTRWQHKCKTVAKCRVHKHSLESNQLQLQQHIVWTKLHPTLTISGNLGRTHD